MNLRISLETDSILYWVLADNKKGADLGLGGLGDLRRAVPVDYWGVKRRLPGAKGCQGVRKQN